MVVGHLTIVDMIAIINTWTRKRVISRQNVCLSNAKVRRNTQCLYFKYKSTTSNVLMVVGHSTVFEMTAIVFRLEYRHLDMWSCHIQTKLFVYSMPMLDGTATVCISNIKVPRLTSRAPTPRHVTSHQFPPVVTSRE